LSADIAIAFLLLPRMGATGAAWATLGSTTLASALFLALAATKRHVRTTVVLTQALRRLIPALFVALIPAYFLARTVASRSWPAIVGIVALSAPLYLLILWIYAASADEKTFLADLFRHRQFAPKATGSAGEN